MFYHIILKALLFLQISCKRGFIMTFLSSFPLFMSGILVTAMKNLASKVIMC
jgi:hypothetical protein